MVKSLNVLIQVNKETTLYRLDFPNHSENYYSCGTLHFTFQSLANKLWEHAEFSQEGLTAVELK